MEIPEPCAFLAAHIDLRPPICQGGSISSNGGQQQKGFNRGILYLGHRPLLLHQRTFDSRTRRWCARTVFTIDTLALGLRERIIAYVTVLFGDHFVTNLLNRINVECAS